MSGSSDYTHDFAGASAIMRHLRGPEGCPWDRRQTRDDLKAQFLEECYELVEAIEEGDASKVAEELGDVVLHVLFQLEIGHERGEFTPEDVFGGLIDKLRRRHTHVFGDADAGDADEVMANWQAIKRRERRQAGESILDGVPRGMPALSHAQALQQRASHAGFDWDDVSGVLDKLSEEIGELAESEGAAEREAEFGDLLFATVNAGRWLDLDAEGALRQANARFYRRFELMERMCRDRGLAFEALPLDDKERLWQEAKRRLATPSVGESATRRE